jgi:hypothetical protein
MNRKRFRSHWKELLATEVSGADPGEEAKAPDMDGELSAVNQAWSTARAVLHRYRYQWLVVTFLALALCLGVVYGPGDGRPARVRVSGQVLIDGQPLTRGTILFVPQGARPAAATLDPQGHFQLTSFDDQDGVVPGTHRLAVAPGGVPGETDAPWPVPARYADYQTSGLCVEVTEATDDVVVELTSRDEPLRGAAGEFTSRRVDR